MSQKSNSPREVIIKNIPIGGNNPIALIAGPCVIESEDHALKTAKHLKQICSDAKIGLIYKSSYDKANRSSLNYFRGPGISKGLRILEKVKKELDLPILSDIHKEEEVEPAAEVLDILQIPAFLCRQTDLLVKAGKTGKTINVKKGQFMAPWDMKNIPPKVESTGNKNILLTERGVSFGYNNLVVDMRSLIVMRDLGYPVVFDATHSVQLPGGRGDRSGGQREMAPPLIRGAIAIGCDALFIEVHEDPDNAPSDGPNMIKIEDLPNLLKQVKTLDKLRLEGFH
jgi:2-dehydro-3-deoxyphosphooctonate aldolase (KDO 8-P synthase)